MIGLGTMINTAAILVGGLCGALFGRFLHDSAQDTLTKICGVSTLFIAITGALEEMLRVEGQVRSHNVRENGVRRLLIFVFAASIIAEDGDPINDVILCGPLCRDPNCRRTPLGRDICDVMLAVPRAYHRADYLPCILWGRTAQEVSQCHTRDVLKICGRLQSRNYTKLTDNGSETRTAYEISALTADILEDQI